jgi:hypothetical protein
MPPITPVRIIGIGTSSPAKHQWLEDVVAEKDDAGFVASVAKT